jgi:hypothetical protein
MFLTPSKISLPSAMIFSSLHHPAGMCLSAYSGGAGGGGPVLSGSSAQPAARNATPPTINNPIKLVIFIIAPNSFPVSKSLAKKRRFAEGA